MSSPMQADNAVLTRLAYGELQAAEALELHALKDQIRQQSGFFCGGYKERCLRRRLAIRMRARAVHRYADYAELLDGDPEEFRRLLAALTINVSKFFRNIEVWERLRHELVPELLRVEAPEVRIWSAGSAGGEEPYSMAILLLDYALEHGLTDRLERVSIVGTDIDHDCLDAAVRAEYGDLALSETPAAIRERWFATDHRHRLRDEVRRLVRFVPLDLLTDPFPSEQHLVFCRNVTIYFERSVQERLLQRLHGALAPGGYLVLGKVETLYGPLSRQFRTLSNPQRIFQKL